MYVGGIFCSKYISVPPRLFGALEYLVTKNKEIHDEKKNFLLLDCNINWEEQKTSCGQCVRNIIHDSLLVDGIFCRFHTHW